jgi:hypothetical protein
MKVHVYVLKGDFLSETVQKGNGSFSTSKKVSDLALTAIPSNFKYSNFHKIPMTFVMNINVFQGNGDAADSPPLHVLPSFSNTTPSSQEQVRPKGVGKQNVLHRPLLTAHFLLTGEQKKKKIKTLEEIGTK